MKKTLLLIFFTAITYGTFAQTYSDKAAEVKKLITADAGPEFALTNVPAQYVNESAVILAQSYKTQRTTNTKFKYMIFTAAVTKRVLTITTYHERVKINDKSALEEYSTIEYQKKLDKSMSLLWNKFMNSHDTYIGATITKPNGQQITVNTGEEVLLKNTGKDQQGKLAIPGLQVGDILDYYVSSNDQNETGENNTDDKIFLLAGSHPILNYSVVLQYDSKSMPYILTANGAPKFTESTGENGDKIFSLNLKDLPRRQSQLWSSTYRQIPYIEVGGLERKKGPSKADLMTGVSVVSFNSNKLLFEKSFNDYYSPFTKEPEKKTKDYFESNKAYKAAPLDSTMRVFYNAWKYLVYDSYTKDEADNINELNYRKAKSWFMANYVSRLLTDMEIAHDILLVSSRESNSLENSFNKEDFDAMVRVDNGGKPLYMSFANPLMQFNEVPSQFQGEQALSLRSKRKNAQNYEFTESTVTIPVSSADKNFIENSIAVTIPADNMLKLKFIRKVREGGAMRFSDQLAMVSPAEVDKAIAAAIKGDPLEKRIAKNSDIRKLADVFQSNMGRSVTENKKIFTEEIKSEFDQEPQQLADMKILNTGMHHASPVFEHSASFTLDNLVKKAGNNYILDAGKLAGNFLKLDDKDRKRDIDVYMPYARVFKYSISIAIPQGYRVKGLEEFNKQKSNKTGYFTSSAMLEGSTLKINVSRAYNNNFEKAADWPMVTELIDAASAFNDQKILLEKES